MVALWAARWKLGQACRISVAESGELVAAEIVHVCSLWGEPHYICAVGDGVEPILRVCTDREMQPP